MIVAGVGLRTGCTAEEIADLVRRAIAESGCQPGVLAVPQFRAASAAPLAAAGALSLALIVVEADALLAVQDRCQTKSAVAEAVTGLASIAEACALAAAGPGSVLRLLRIASANATCAIAEGGGMA